MAIEEPTFEGDKAWFKKDPDDKYWYGADVAEDLSISGTSIASVDVNLGTGMVKLADPEFNGSKVKCFLTGIGATEADSYCTFRILCVNGEQFDRTICFRKVDH